MHIGTIFLAIVIIHKYINILTMMQKYTNKIIYTKDVYIQLTIMLFMLEFLRFL